MTIEEAVEIFKTGHAGALFDDACHVLADAYVRLTDPTPLTVEVIERELGPADKLGQWKVGDQYIGWNTPFRCANVNGFTFTTLGDLRQIVAMLRKVGGM